jgi:16S rRNA U516 pseudouridylate synthase RsuA-like enzyme
MNDAHLVRLQKLLAQSGVASRRRCEEVMLAGLVEVDGEIVSRLGTKVDPRTAVVSGSVPTSSTSPRVTRVRITPSTLTPRIPETRARLTGCR